MTNAEIQLGEFIRTKRGIAKVEQIGNDTTHKTIWYTVDRALDHVSFLVREQEVVIHSHNIIDLIETGDYIKMGKNNYYLGIDNIYEFAGELNIRTSNDFLWEDVKNDKDFTVYSIITHEQMKSMEYKVGGEDD